MDPLLATQLAVVAGIVRATAGWAENALKDGKVERFEWYKLLGTILDYVAKINLLSIGLSPELATSVYLLVDIGKSVVSKLGGKE